MTTTGTSTGATAPLVPALMRLGKVRLFEIWLGPIVAWSLVIGSGQFDVRSSVLCLLFFGTLAFGMWSSHAFDDITGFKDGSDLRNYAPERNRSQVKPLVHGQLTVKQAQVFAYTTAALAIATVVLFCAVSAFRPWWVFVVALAIVFFGVQYSAGINFSYRFIGGGEALTGITLAFSVVLPYVAATQRVDWAIVVEGLLFGLWLTQVLSCSNSADAADDRLVGRRTVAALTSERGNRVFVTALFVSSWLLAIGAVAFGAFSPWTLLALLPAWLFQVHVLRNGLRGQWRNKRNYGFFGLRFAVLGLVVVNVLA